jgi:hypothetical protein
MAKVMPSSSGSHEARPGLSHGIDLRGKRRGGAPRGERADRKARGPCFAGTAMVVRLSALRSLFLGAKDSFRCWQSSDASTHRENEFVYVARPRQGAG